MISEAKVDQLQKDSINTHSQLNECNMQVKNLNEENVDLELTDTEKPGVIRINGYVYIVLPMRLS